VEAYKLSVDPRSKVSRARAPATCGQRHTETYNESVHGNAMARGITPAPEPGSLVNPARVSSVTCGRCHGDERLNARFNLPAQKVGSYQDSFHGESDAKSTVNAKNPAHTCGTCHPGAGERFAISLTGC
jgi:hypothetical protein